MGNQSENKYDVVIIGAGIAGLIAGNYLANAGLKMFIAEQHYAVGGNNACLVFSSHIKLG